LLELGWIKLAARNATEQLLNVIDGRDGCLDRREGQVVTEERQRFVDYGAERRILGMRRIADPEADRGELALPRERRADDFELLRRAR
jgi:hypothetical protein